MKWLAKSIKGSFTPDESEGEITLKTDIFLRIFLYYSYRLAAKIKENVLFRFGCIPESNMVTMESSVIVLVRPSPVNQFAVK